MADDNDTEEMTREEILATIKRGPDGRILPGSMLGKLAAGVPKYSRQVEKERKRVQREMTKTLREQADEMLAERLGPILETLYTKATDEKDTAALTAWLRHAIPAPKPDNRIDEGLLEGIANLPAEERIRWINRAALEGSLELDKAKELIALCKSEMEAQTILRMQRLARRANAQELSIEDLLTELNAIAQDLEPVLIEGGEDGEG